MTAGTTPPDSDRREDRLAAWKIAVFSGFVGIAGAVVGGFFSYLVAVHDTNSQRTVERNDYIRQQSQSAYAKMISDGTEILYSVGGCADAKALLAMDPVDRKRAATKLAAAIRQLDEDSATVQIVGSDAAAADAASLENAIGRVKGLCIVGSEDQINTATHDALDARQQLIADARSDLLTN